uniref:Amino acid-binding ACT domain protein n=1 Tax=uncultured bacterium W4-21b TaxID=1130993 RepID=H9BWP5_9BACT|nr:amino acid-binding ACT domain protein [uncultured bacterium W4-21b]
MPIRQQLSVFLENRPGMLARACSVLSENGINVLALSIHDTVDHAVVRFLVDMNTKALLLIESEGFYVLEQDVVVVDVDNRPGSLAEVARKLAKADINIDYAYCTANEGQSNGCLVLKTDEPERALDILTGFC